MTGCHSVKIWRSSEAPSAMGKITVATPAAKMKVIATSRRRFWKALAKYAGNMNEMQQGAKSAIPPATTAAITEPPKKMLLVMYDPHIDQLAHVCTRPQF